MGLHLFDSRVRHRSPPADFTDQAHVPRQPVSCEAGHQPSWKMILQKHFEELMEQQDSVQKRMKDIKQGKVQGRNEKELDDYLKKRGVLVG